MDGPAFDIRSCTLDSGFSSKERCASLGAGVAGLAFGRHFGYRHSSIMCVAALTGIVVLAGCGGGGAGAVSSKVTTSAAAVKATSKPTPSVWPSPGGTDWVIFHGDCDCTMKAWSTFLEDYKNDTSLPEKNLAAATAAADIADAAYDLDSKLPMSQPVVAVLAGRMETFSQDFQVVEKDLQNGDTGAAGSAIKTRLQGDENAVSAICGPPV